MRTFIKNRFKQLGSSQAAFMEKAGIKRDFARKCSNMESKLSKLNEFYNHLDCEVIIVDKREPIETSINYKKIFPL